MNQNKYSRLLQTLNQCGVNNADKLVSDFKQFMKYQKLNKDIDNMIEQAHEKKISDQEFKAMIDEQKDIMKSLGVRNIKFKEPPSSIKKPNLNVLENREIELPNKDKNIKVFNITEITTYNLEGDKYVFFGPNNQVVEKVRLSTGEVKKVSELSNNQKENISESIDNKSNIVVKPIKINKPENLETVKKPKPVNKKQNKSEPVKKSKPVKKQKKSEPVKKSKPVKKQNKSKPIKKSKPRKTINSKPVPKKKTQRNPTKDKKPRRKTQKLNKYWFHQLPEHAIKNVSVVKGKRRRLPPKKKTPEKLIKNIPEVNKKGERVPFRGFFDLFKL